MKSIPRVTSLSGSVEAPPSKSLTARAFLLAAMAEGETIVERPLDSDDPRYLLDAIRKDKPYNEVERGAMASLVTVMGRMAAHTGRVVTLEEIMVTPSRFRTAVSRTRALPV